MIGVKFLSDLPFPLTRKKNHEDGVASCKYPFDMLVLPEDWDFAETKFETFLSRIDSSHQKISYLCSFTFLSLLLDPTFLHHTDQFHCASTRPHRQLSFVDAAYPRAYVNLRLDSLLGNG